MADLIAYTDLAGYLGVTFTAAEQVTAATACGAASDAVRTAVNRTFEIQGSATDRYFSASTPYSSNLGALAYFYPYPGVFPFTALSLNMPAPILYVDDFFLTNQTIGQITVTDKTTLTTYTPASAYPYNADAKGFVSTGLVFAAGTVLPTGEGQLKVHAKWGWPSLPSTLINAALIQASRYFKRKDAPFGVAGNDAMGNAMRLRAELDPDVALMCSNARRWWGAA